MTKLTGKNYTWEPHMSDWQRDRASAPFDRVPHGSGFASAAISALLIGFVFYVLVCVL